MGKLFAVVLTIIAIASAVPIVMHTWEPPQDISTHGYAIDEQLSETMVEAGVSFLAAQFLLAFFVWRFAGRKEGAIKSFPGGAKLMVGAAILLVGSEILALGAVGQKACTQCPSSPGASRSVCFLLSVPWGRPEIRADSS
jgi:hypothetical protein